MTDKNRTYVAIDLKSFYSSVECVARGLDPLTTNLVVADVSRTEKTICLAVSPSMKAYGLGHPTSSSQQIIHAVTELYDRIVNPVLLIRRLNITVNHVISEDEARRQRQNSPVQLDLFTDYEAEAREQKKERNAAAKERRLQEAALKIKKEFGKNALLRGLNYAEGATQKERNNQLGGHKA